MKELKKVLKKLLDFIENSRKLLESGLNGGIYDLDVIYHLKNVLEQYILLKPF